MATGPDSPPNKNEGTAMPSKDLEKLQAQQQQAPHGGMPPEPDGRSQELRLASLDWEMAALRREIAELKKVVDEHENDKEKAMRWGILTLGAAVLGMGIWIFQFFVAQLGK